MDQYIIFGKNHYQYNGFDINRLIFHDAIEQENVLYVEPRESFWNRYLRFFYTNEYGIAFRKKLFLPFRKAAFHAMLQKANRISRTDLPVFVFFFAEPWFFGKKSFLEYLKQRYKGAKLVYHITNTIKNIRNRADYYSQFFDLVSTCDRGDSLEYGIPYYPNTCSYVSFSENTEPASDCFFVGQAKNRLTDLHAIFEILNHKGVACEFYISGVKESEQKYGDLIHYNQILNYDVILRKIEKTNVILELLQEGMDSHTLRYPEAVNYGKKLITNNANAVNEKCYCPENIRIIRKPEDVSAIDNSFFKSPLAVEYPNRDSASSRNFISFIRAQLDSR